MDDLLSTQYLVALKNGEPSNYTMVPNIIDHLTYDEIDSEGKIVTKRLSVYATHLYRVLRSVAGQENATWKNTENLAEISNMSVGQIVKCKKELMQKFHELEGQPLIEITERKKCTFKSGEKLNGTVYHLVSINNIWGFNRAYFYMKKLLKQADSPHEPAGMADSPHESALEEAHSLSERNKITNTNTPLSKEQDSTAEAVSVCSLDPGDVVVSEQTRMFNWLMQIGFDILSAKSIIDNFTSKDLFHASGYVQKIMQKKKISNIVGYLRKTLENRWWESNNDYAREC